MSRLRSLALFVAAVPGAAEAQRLGTAPPADVSLVRVFLALLVCLIVAVLALFLIRQRMGGRPPALLMRLRAPSSRIRLVESRRIGMQAELCIARCDDEEYLLLLAPSGSVMLRHETVPAAGGEDE